MGQISVNTATGQSYTQVQQHILVSYLLTQRNSNTGSTIIIPVSIEVERLETQ